MKRLRASAGLLIAHIIVLGTGRPLFAASDVDWKNTLGDGDVSNSANWNAGTLPDGQDYNARFSTASTEVAPLVMTSLDAMHPSSIKVTKSSVFDLGAGKELTATSQFQFNQTRMTLVLRSGVLGVNWSGGNRVFIGDSGTENAVTVVGEYSIFVGANMNDNRSIYIGSNTAGNSLTVTDGGTVKGTISLGHKDGAATNNTLYVSGPKSRHIVPADALGSLLGVGGKGGFNTAIFTNGASFVSDSANAVEMSYYTTSVPIGGTNTLKFLDRAKLALTNGTVVAGDSGSGNLLEVGGGSEVVCREFIVGKRPNSKVQDVVFGNRAVFWGEGTRLKADSLVVGQGPAVGAEFRAFDGAQLDLANVNIDGVSGLLMMSNLTYSSLDVPFKRAFYIGQNGSSNGFLAVDSEINLPSNILRVGHNDLAAGNWVHFVRTPATLYRVILHEKGRDGSFVIENSRVTASGAFELGAKDNENSFGAEVVFRGPGAFLQVGEGFKIGRDATVAFDFAGGAFTNSPVAKLSSLSVYDTVSDERGCTLRIDVGKDFSGGGTYTLIESSKKDALKWDKVRLVYDENRVRIVEQSANRLKVRVRPIGFAIIFR